MLPVFCGAIRFGAIGLVLSVLRTRYSLASLCTLNPTPLWDVRLETGALPGAEVVPTVSPTDPCLSIISCSNTDHFPCQGPRPVVKLQPTLHDMNRAVWMNCSFVLALELVSLFYSLEMSTELSPAPAPSPGPVWIAAHTRPQVVFIAVVSFFQCKEV